MRKKRSRVSGMEPTLVLLQESIASITSQIVACVNKDSIGALRRLLKRIANEANAARGKDRGKLRKLTHGLLGNIKRQGKVELDRVEGRNIGLHNLLIVTSFLTKKSKGQVPRGLRGRRIQLSSLANYFTKFAPALRYSVYFGKRLGDFLEHHWQVVLRRHPSSARILNELIKSELPRNSQIDLRAIGKKLGLLRLKKRTVLDFIAVTTKHPLFGKLSIKEKSVVGLALDLLLRKMEIANLKIEDITFDFPLPGITVMGKGKKKMIIPLTYSTHLIPILKEIIQERTEGYLICKSNGKKYTGEGIAKICARALGKMGFPPVHIHFLRHLGINKLILAGMPMEEVSEIARHAHIKTTDQEYTHVQAYLAVMALENSSIYEKIFQVRPMSLTVGEAAGIIGCGKRNVQAALKKKRIKGEKIGGRWYLPESEAYRAKVIGRLKNRDNTIGPCVS